MKNKLTAQIKKMTMVYLSTALLVVPLLGGAALTQAAAVVGDTVTGQSGSEVGRVLGGDVATISGTVMGGSSSNVNSGGGGGNSLTGGGSTGGSLTLGNGSLQQTGSSLSGDATESLGNRLRAQNTRLASAVVAANTSNEAVSVNQLQLASVGSAFPFGISGWLWVAIILLGIAFLGFIAYVLVRKKIV